MGNQWSGLCKDHLQWHTMIEIAIIFRNVKMFSCLFAAFNASEALDALKRIFLDSRPDGHLG